MENWSWPEFTKGLAGDLVRVAVFVGLPAWLVITHKEAVIGWLELIFGPLPRP